MNDISPEPRPVRVNLAHDGVPSAARLAGPPVFFLTVCVENRMQAPLLPVASTILDSVRYRHGIGKWFLRLALVMPDHVHLLISFPEKVAMSAIVGDWKRFLARKCGIEWQRNFFDHRIRTVEELTEKWEYIRLNPVRKGFCETPDAWPHWCAFDPVTGTENR